MTSKFNLALALAIDAHTGQIRKSTENSTGMAVPYITHPVAVSALVVRYGGNEDQAIAALLHDVLEDGDKAIDWTSRIAVFGEHVLHIVQGCTDGTPDPTTGEKAPWRERKESYLTHLVDASSDVLLVSACDKLNNLQAIHLDLVETGLSVFEIFSANRDDVLWYYQTLCEIFTQRSVAPAAALNKELQAVRTKIHELLNQ